MPQFTIRTTNSKFFTEAVLPDQPLAETAHAYGVRGAIMIASDEINAGLEASVVEVAVDDAEGQTVLRSAVSISVAPLATGAVEEMPLPEKANDRWQPE